MKQILKETIITWIVIILIVASVCAIVGAPFLLFTYAGMGVWQLIVCALWYSFWVAFAITVI